MVEQAKNGTEAIGKSKKITYNAALIDIKLPDVEGVELLTRLKDTVPKMRKIIITGFPSLENAISSLNKGADAYLVKPVDPEKLIELMRTQLSKQKAEQKITEEKVAQFIEGRMRDPENISRTSGAKVKKPFMNRRAVE
jgi:YesN/AraC family two-component response regulator